jgi:beta-N-acetylhexosaminidase
MNSLAIRPYAHETDESTVFALWRQALGATWPLSQETFHGVTVGAAHYRPGDHWIAELGEETIGFVATLTRRSPQDGIMVGEIVAALVAAAYQRQGIGRRLIDQALAHLGATGAAFVQLGSGAGTYFWPGVPENLPGAVAFFQKLGWSFHGVGVDMSQDLTTYTTPAYVWERARQANITVRTASAADMQDIVTFEAQYFPNWLGGFTSPAAKPGEIVLAQTASGQIVGTASLHSPGVEPRPKWTRILGEDMGSFGGVGVDPNLRERGIGLALSARASEVLKERGARHCHVGWVWSAPWYAKLGYQVWRSYQLGRKQLE